MPHVPNSPAALRTEIVSRLSQHQWVNVIRAFNQLYTAPSERMERFARSANLIQPFCNIILKEPFLLSNQTEVHDTTTLISLLSNMMVHTVTPQVCDALALLLSVCVVEPTLQEELLCTLTALWNRAAYDEDGITIRAVGIILTACVYTDNAVWTDAIGISITRLAQDLSRTLKKARLTSKRADALGSLLVACMQSADNRWNLIVQEGLAALIARLDKVAWSLDTLPEPTDDPECEIYLPICQHLQSLLPLCMEKTDPDVRASLIPYALIAINALCNRLTYRTSDVQETACETLRVILPSLVATHDPALWPCICPVLDTLLRHALTEEDAELSRRVGHTLSEWLLASIDIPDERIQAHFHYMVNVLLHRLESQAPKDILSADKAAMVLARVLPRFIDENVALQTRLLAVFETVLNRCAKKPAADQTLSALLMLFGQSTAPTLRACVVRGFKKLSARASSIQSGDISPVKDNLTHVLSTYRGIADPLLLDQIQTLLTSLHARSSFPNAQEARNAKILLADLITHCAQSPCVAIQASIIPYLPPLFCTTDDAEFPRTVRVLLGVLKGYPEALTPIQVQTVIDKLLLCVVTEKSWDYKKASDFLEMIISALSHIPTHIDMLHYIATQITYLAREPQYTPAHSAWDTLLLQYQQAQLAAQGALTASRAGTLGLFGRGLTPIPATADPDEALLTQLAQLLTALPAAAVGEAAEAVVALASDANGTHDQAKILLGFFGQLEWITPFVTHAHMSVI